MSENKERITITIDAELLRKIDEISEKRGEPRSALIERILSLQVPDMQKSLDEMENPILRALASAFKESDTLMSLAAKIAGHKLTSEQLAQMKGEASKQIGRGKERQQAKKKRVQEDGEVATGSYPG